MLGKMTVKMCYFRGEREYEKGPARYAKFGSDKVRDAVLLLGIEY
jgi:hypothetical protein